jgi:diguanylate cyclase (GGDEF)-like protein
MPEDRGARRQPLNSLATKIILFVFTSTFVTALVVSWISIQSTHDSLLGVVDRMYPIALDRAVVQLEDWIDRGRDDTVYAAASERRPTAPRLAAAVEASEPLVGLVAVGRDGRVRASGGPASVGIPAAALAQLLPIHSQTLRTIPLAGGEQAVAVWVPFATPSDDAAGLLGIFERAALESILSGELPDAASALALVDAAGRRLAQAGRAPESWGEELLTDPPREDPASVRDYESGGVHMIGAARRLSEVGWRVVVQTPFDAAFEPVLSVVTRIFAIDLCVILLFSFLAYRVTATVVRPIERLSEGARQIGQGDIEHEIPEPNSHDELGLLTRTFNDMMRQLRRNQEEIETANRHLKDRNARLQQANEVLNQLSITDGLTKLHNHRFFQDHMTREIKRVGRTGEALSMLMLDLDDFKRLNDRFGHAAGDELLTRIARILNGSVRESDFLARYGGEEFVILASDTDLAGAEVLAEKVRTAIAESSFILDESLRPLQVTVSVGVAQFEGNRKQFFRAADQALYRAKAAGKNCVVIAGGDAREPGEDTAQSDRPAD